MDFLEAVKALKNRECEGIRPGLNALYIKLHDGILRWTGRGGSEIRADQFTSDQWVLVNPKPRTKEREVERWLCNQCQFITLLSHQICPQCLSNTPPVKLTGTYEVEIPRKVKKRVELKGFVGQSIDGTIVPLDANVFAEWEE
jgi:hypothetical protein